MNLQEIKEREAKATPGPWEYLPGEFNYDDEAENHPGSIHQVETGDNRGWWIAAIEELFEGQTLANADFIAHAREDIPALVAEVERLQAENKRLKESLADSLCNCGYILPSRIALDPANHSVNCAYTRAMEAIP
jgi:hypothetical protein